MLLYQCGFSPPCVIKTVIGTDKVPTLSSLKIAAHAISKFVHQCRKKNKNTWVSDNNIWFVCFFSWLHQHHKTSLTSYLSRNQHRGWHVKAAHIAYEQLSQNYAGRVGIYKMEGTGNAAPSTKRRYYAGLWTIRQASLLCLTLKRYHSFWVTTILKFDKGPKPQWRCWHSSGIVNYAYWNMYIYMYIHHMVKHMYRTTYIRDIRRASHVQTHLHKFSQNIWVPKNE